MLLGLVVSYMVLAFGSFNSFVHPVAVLLALPFSISGAFIGLLLFHQSLNIFSLIGLILLMGIVKKNSILLVDFTNQCRAEGLNVREALISRLSREAAPDLDDLSGDRRGRALCPKLWRLGLGLRRPFQWPLQSLVELWPQRF